MNRIRVGLIGVGRAGRVHATNLTRNVGGAELVAVASRDADAAGAFASDFGAEASSVADLINGDSVDAVLITTATELHAELTVRCAEAGKHVFSEKPIAMTAAQGREVAAAVRASGIVYQLGYMHRYDPDLMELRELVASRELGAPTILRSITRAPGRAPAWVTDPDGPGLIAEIASHDLDAVRWLAGAEFEAVMTQATDIRSPEHGAESYLITGRLDSGALFAVEMECGVGYGYDSRVEVGFASGVALAGTPAHPGVRVAGGERRASGRTYASWAERFAAGFDAQLRSFVTSVSDGRPASPSAEDGVRVLEAVEAAQRSHRSGAMEQVQRLG